MTDVRQQDDRDDGHGRPDHEPKLVTIIVNRRRVEVSPKTTGAAIKAAAGVEPSLDLFKIEGKDEIPVGDDQKIEVKNGDRFVATPSLDPS